MPKRKSLEEVEEVDNKRMKRMDYTNPLTSLPNEVLHHILKDVNIPDVARYDIFQIQEPFQWMKDERNAWELYNVSGSWPTFLFAFSEYGFTNWIELTFKLARLSETCRALHEFTKGNQALFKELYLQRLVGTTYYILHFLIMSQDGSQTDARDWEEDLHLLAKVERIFESEDERQKVSAI